jgi:hypothetical protein
MVDATSAARRPVDYPKRINKTLAKVSSWWIYGFGLIPALWYFYLGATNNLGANPIQARRSGTSRGSTCSASVAPSAC